MKRNVFFAIAFCTSLCLYFSFTVSAQTQNANETPEALKQRIDQLQRRMNDWAQLSRYREANTKLSPPAKDEERVVFMGDSITDVWKLDQFFPGKPFINRGISGQTTPQMLIRFRPDVIALKPRVVVILAGTNDIAGNTGEMSLEDIEGNLSSMVELARTNGIRVVMASVLPIHDYGTAKRSERRPPEKIRQLNEWIKNYCKTNGHIYLDYYSHMLDETGMLKKEFANDGLHPNKDGYDVMKPLVEAAIKEALKKKK